MRYVTEHTHYKMIGKDFLRRYHCIPRSDTVIIDFSGHVNSNFWAEHARYENSKRIKAIMHTQFTARRSISVSAFKRGPNYFDLRLHSGYLAFKSPCFLSHEFFEIIYIFKTSYQFTTSGEKECNC